MRFRKRKICAIITARPSYSRVKSLLLALKTHGAFELQIVTVASANLGRFGDVSSVIESDGFNVNEKIYSYVEGDSLLTSITTTGLSLIELGNVLFRLNPDAVITIADRYETIANAIAASYLNIPLIHLQGGETTGNIDEKVRHAVTKLSDIHFPACDTARKRLLQMGENPERVFLFGCPSLDIIKDIPKTGLSENLDFINKHIGISDLMKIQAGYYVVLQHSTTDEVDDTEKNILETLQAVRKLASPAFIFLPNPDAGSGRLKTTIMNLKKNYNCENFFLINNLEPYDFMRLVYHSKCLIGNSSVGIRECSYLGVPVVNIGRRQKNRERGCNVIDVGHSKAEIYRAIRQWEERPRPERSYIYGNGDAGMKIANCLSKIELSFNKRFYSAP